MRDLSAEAAAVYSLTYAECFAAGINAEMTDAEAIEYATFHARNAEEVFWANEERAAQRAGLVNA